MLRTAERSFQCKNIGHAAEKQFWKGLRIEEFLLAGHKCTVCPDSAIMSNAFLYSKLDHPEILPAFLGIFLGVIVGSIPVAIPGMPTPLNFFMANSANLMLRELGITIFLSCVGLNAGIKFFDVLLNDDGFYYMALSAIITFIPLMIVAIVGKAVFKVNYLSLCGVLAGATTDPPALAFANGLSNSEATNIGYASVYPLTMLLRILSGQVLAILLIS